MNRFWVRLISTVIFGCIILGSFYLVKLAVKAGKPVSSLSAETKVIEQLPTIVEIQRKLNDLGHFVVVDGLLGPETQKAWDAAIKDKSAANEYP